MIDSPGFWSLRWEDPLTQKIFWSVLSMAVIYGLALLGAQLLNRAVQDPLWRHKRKYLQNKDSPVRMQRREEKRREEVPSKQCPNW